MMRLLLDQVPGQRVGLQTDSAPELYRSLGFAPQPEFWSLVVGSWLDNDANREHVVSLTQYYTATTLDGFIADPDHSLEWLFTRDQDREAPELRRVHRRRRGDGDGIVDVPVDPRPRVRGQGPGGLEVAVRPPVLGVHEPGAAGRAGGADPLS